MNRASTRTKWSQNTWRCSGLTWTWGIESTWRANSELWDLYIDNLALIKITSGHEKATTNEVCFRLGEADTPLKNRQLRALHCDHRSCGIVRWHAQTNYPIVRFHRIRHWSMRASTSPRGACDGAGQSDKKGSDRGRSERDIARIQGTSKQTDFCGAHQTAEQKTGQTSLRGQKEMMCQLVY